jgi:hypothetical protein
MIKRDDVASTVTRKVWIDSGIEIVEIDFSVPRLIRIVPINSKSPNKEYVLKVTSKGGATLV